LSNSAPTPPAQPAAFFFKIVLRLLTTELI
jgi:hypothetical protein